jgi:hypothetical protein
MRFDFLRKPTERSFKNYIKILKQSPDEEVRLRGTEFEETIPFILGEFYPEMSLTEIENMRWKDVQFKLRQATRRVDMQLSAFDIESEKRRPSLPTSVGKYQNIIVNWENYR